MNGDRLSGNMSGFVETPLGIISASRNWYHTTSDAIEAFVPGLLKTYDLENIIHDAEAWVKSGDSLAFLLYIGLIYFVDPWICGIGVLVFHSFWYINKSAFVSPLFSGLLKILNHDAVLMAVAVGGLSYLGITGRYTAVIIGIVLFFLFKIGLWRWGIDYLHRRFSKSSFTLNDRLLKMLLVRLAIKNDIEVKEIDQMDKRMKELVFKRKN